MGYFYLILMLLLVGLGQYFIKKGTTKINSSETLLKQYFKRDIIIGALFVGLAPLTYILALKTIPLNVAYMFSSINIIVVSLIGYYAFNESFSRNKLIGIALIIFGVIIYAI